MIDLYTWPTPNGRKVSIMIEECGLPYRVIPVNLGTDEQHSPGFTAINPNGRIPAIVDANGPGETPITLWESGAILMYLAEKTGRFLAANGSDRPRTLQWLMFQVSAIGPIFGQLHHFLRTAPEPVPYAIGRFLREKDRLYGVLDMQLGDAEYLAGTEYTIADIATYPWVARHERHQTDLGDFPNVRLWFERIGARPAVQRGMVVPSL
jgi:GST-like protein